MNDAPLRCKHLRLIDGPLLDPQKRREDTVRRMAADLVAVNAFGSEHDARLALRVSGYPMFDIERLIDDARQAAQTVVVAREMSAP